ncbi:hypothetical protein JHK86_009079 [Glycine max]|nr:hypothetical protein JHK86_009079 [Glycine max]
MSTAPVCLHNWFFFYVLTVLLGFSIIILIPVWELKNAWFAHILTCLLCV